MTSDSDQNSQIQFCISIGIVCTKVIQTGGAGDNVSGMFNVLKCQTFVTMAYILRSFSAAGLVLQI